jgi:hypothetical protein
MRLVMPSSATAFAPFSQNSAMLRWLSGLGQAQLWQSKPFFWLSFSSSPTPRTGPMRPMA